ncbi:T9SS type B sorting domain-containing protein [Luteibaculum oceani]|uniref:T9SS type B sorting domain-containing protein n=1 Tax=Luteibaculum oceani TaxID=1294296 RepID=A0A5C6VLR4_9FLAO|nr:gliding motility-associated C-terminal domain-containing protein [Luteibaculum oceani]TXC85436.1 T9SS type B sorting domain-containing protein [Luteibaculum oceani]
MSKIFNLITVCVAFLAWQIQSYGQAQPTGVGVGTVFPVDYENVPNIYTDAEGPSNNYIDGGDESFAEFQPVGVGTFVRVSFTATDIEPNDTLFVYEDNTRAPGNQTDTLNNNLRGAPITFTGSAASNGRISFVWFESGGVAAAGWEANVDLVNSAGTLIPSNYNWIGFAEGNDEDFVFSPGMSNQAYVFCGFDASVRWVMDDDFSANGQTFEFKDLGSYKQRLDSVVVDWGDGSPLDTFNVDEVANRLQYDNTGQSEFNTPTHTYAAVGRYTVRLTGIDEIGVASQTQTIDIIVEGDEPTNKDVTEADVCIGDPATLVSDVEWIVSDYNARILTQRWEGPSPSNPTGPDVVLKNGSPGDNFLNINPSAYPAPADGGPAFFDYTFTHYVTFDNGCGEVATPVRYRVYKLPNAGDANPNADNEVCEDLADFDLNTLLDPASNPDPDGVWTDNGGNVVPNGIVSPMPAPGSYTYKYTVSNPECPSDQDQVTLTVLRKPYAGKNDGTSISNPLKLCVDQQNVDLFALLDGDPSRPTPDINGQWLLVESGTETALNSPQINSSRFLDASQFNVNPPQASKLFQLCYEVKDETGECSPTRECVYVRIYPEPYVVPTTVDTQVCENDPIIAMDNLVDDAFRTSGNWENYQWPAGASRVQNQAFFEPNKETVAGTYKFRKYYRNPDNQGNDICRIDSIIVTVEFFLKPEAGPDANYSICPSAPINLYDTLLSAADTDGDFFGPLETVGDVPTANPTAFQFDTDGGTFTFNYRVEGDGPCPDDAAVLTFNVSPFKDPGMSNSILACTADGPRTLINELNGTPDNGGTWSPTVFLSGTSENAKFNASAAGAGTFTYTYTFPKDGECPAVSSQLQIEVYNEPKSGADFAETICNVDMNKKQYFYSLSDQISGNANGAVHGVAPATDVMEEFGALESVANAVTNSNTGLVNVKNLGGGTYNFFYRTFNAGCEADTAFFKITVNQVGFAGKDSLFVRCSTEPVVNMKDYLGPGANTTGIWEDTDGAGGLVGATYNATFDPANVELQSPDTGFRHIYIVEVPECPDDSANVVAYVSKKLESGTPKGGDDSLLYACEDENAVNLLNGFVPNSFDEPLGNPGRPLYGRWKLVKPNAGYLVPQQVLDEVNKRDRSRFFTGADSSEFDVEEFVKYWEGTETINGSRQYSGGVNNLSFWQWLKTDRLLYFEYTVRDTSAGKLTIPTYYEGTSTAVPREIGCGKSSSVVIAAVMPDYDKRFTLEVDPAGPGDITVCNSITDLDLKQYFSELRRDPAKLDIRDIFNPKFDTIAFDGIPGTPDPVTDGTIYNQSPSQPYFLDISRLAPTMPKPPVPNNKNPYNVRLKLTSGKDKNNKCGEARTQVGLRINVEKIPQPGGGPGPGQDPLTEYSICEGSPTFNMHTQISGTKDPFDPNRHFFTAVTSNANGRILGQNFRMTGANPNLYIVRYNIPTVACVNPVVSSVNDPGNNNNPKNFSSLLEITVTSGPDLDGFDQQVNEFDVCSDPVTNLGDLFPLGNNIDQSGTFTILTNGCGAIDNANNWNNAVYNRGTTNCSSVLIEYEVNKGDCPPATLQIRLNITPKPYPGANAKDTICLNNGLYDLYGLLAKNQIPGKTIDRNGVFKGRKASTNAGLNFGGFFDPNTAGVGLHTIVYTVGDGQICELDSAVLNIKVNKIERAGTDGSINACAGAPKLDLFDGIKGNYSPIGYFIPCNPDLEQYMEGNKDQIFNHERYRTLEPDPQSQVCFKYVIDARCYNDTATVTVNLSPGPISGGDTTVFICEKLFEYNLFDALGNENVDWLPEGTWRGVSGTPAPSYDGNNSALISPKDLNRGTYKYDYTVEAECADTVLTSTSRVTVKIGDNTAAGRDTTIAVCYNGIINLDVFFGTNGAGVWIDTNGIGGLVDGNMFDLGQTNDGGIGSTYEYAYRVPALYENCGPTVAFFTVDVRRQPNAGRDTTVFYCNVAGQEFPALDLFPQRSANQKLFPSPGISAAGALSGGVFFPDRLSAGNYSIRLIITDSECGKDTAIANIYIQDKDDANSILCGDLDGDGVRNNQDLDVDGDGISNLVESRIAGGNRNPFGNHDNDALLNFQDADYAALVGSTIKNGVVAAFDFDGDGLINALDLDSDNDLIPDIVEAFGADNYAAFDGNSDGKTDAVNAAGINNTTKGLTDNGSAPLSFQGPGIAPFDYLNKDSDGDGIGDQIEARPNNDLAGTTFVFAVVDTDVDDTPDYLDTDSDNDGISDSRENQGGSLLVVINTNANPGPGIVVTDNVPNFRDTDSDGDGIEDRREAYKNQFGVPNDFDGDGIPNFLDVDSDNDGIADFIEKGPIEIPRNTDKDQRSSFSVSDTLPDFIDFDADGDGIADAIERGNITLGQQPVNTDGDTRADYRDLDADGDKIPDALELAANGDLLDTDMDGIFNFQDVDSDNDRYLDIFEAVGSVTSPDTITTNLFVDFDLDGIPDFLDFDSDDDGIEDKYEVLDNLQSIVNRPFDADGDGTPDFHDADSDDDGLLDEQERGEGDEGTDSAPRDSDGNGIYDFRSIDADGDGILDRLEGDGDCDGDGIPNYRDAGDNCKIETYIPEGFSPNGDRINDFFVIPDSEFFPGNTLRVYNRWGALVFEMENYDNTWDGTKDGDVLPDGTYFYTFDLGIGQEALTGYVFISRN